MTVPMGKISTRAMCYNLALSPDMRVFIALLSGAICYIESQITFLKNLKFKSFARNIFKICFEYYSFQLIQLLCEVD